MFNVSWTPSQRLWRWPDAQPALNKRVVLRLCHGAHNRAVKSSRDGWPESLCGSEAVMWYRGHRSGITWSDWDIVGGENSRDYRGKSDLRLKRSNGSRCLKWRRGSTVRQRPSGKDGHGWETGSVQTGLEERWAVSSDLCGTVLTHSARGPNLDVRIWRLFWRVKTNPALKE